MMSEIMVATLTASLFLPNAVMGFIEWAGALVIIGACFVEILAGPSPDLEAHHILGPGHFDTNPASPFPRAPSYCRRTISETWRPDSGARK